MSVQVREASFGLKENKRSDQINNLVYSLQE